MDKNKENRHEVSDKELFEQYRKTKDVNIRNEIVSRYLYLAEILAKKFINRGVEYDDLYQVACMALINAVERFDVNANVKFVSFATPTIIGEIKRYFRDKASVIRVPRRIYEIYQKVNQTRELLMQKNGRAPRVDEIAEYLNLSEETILEIIESWNVYKIQSFDQTIYDDDDVELHEAIGEDDETFEKINNRDFLEKSLKHFNETEKKFIRLRYFENKTQKEIAENFNVSQMYISRLERKTLEKFRRILKK
ncbi:RNA polymerase factor sigma-70 RpoD [Thermoclostridium stercorarium subsp. stercorarium DSM 8532]|jgi:RNA polymerase sigma-B factor|uniref:RNA polymerase factor sigma-70 RpoD n=3 Tax=Thermoclostridium stercorarium TaxID=1510 RepID=L7VSM2_THES1|nr:SigB/SigF/SigG family RNA polymerase sigma factor [Thermoclostridium stercorarium]AGC69371.1 RNA polymerase factor sigma-70 RpoD [Thermoclostridium stercorarium subsp. stercorarium DSM 8532]AGI40331.1 RNA polymerase sigma-70 factor [Thermoclostridium stercorarium subsp. stercorarium DSM 8532]ANW99625.1 RNA polymerase subunit sigma-70 [Thermoclostridium stercorarium subsp. thermolacticum DSM 2910]ANX02252.1 RNA polymerase subunit sigma-70 [Thermoclostridium stercorarium subsp. leptospartum DS